MSSFSLQINSAGSNISTERVGSNVVVNIDNTATEEATTLATQAATRADEAAGRADQKLAEVDVALEGAVRADVAQGLSSARQTVARRNTRATADKDFGTVDLANWDLTPGANADLALAEAAAIANPQGWYIRLPPFAVEFAKFCAVHGFVGTRGKSKIIIAADFNMAGAWNNEFCFQNPGFSTVYNGAKAPDYIVLRDFDVVSSPNAKRAFFGLANVKGGLVSGVTMTANKVVVGGKPVVVAALLDLYACCKNITVSDCIFEQLTGAYGNTATGPVGPDGGGCMWIRNLANDGTRAKNITENIEVTGCTFRHYTSDEVLAVFGVFGVTRRVSIHHNFFYGLLNSANDNAGAPEGVYHNTLISVFPLKGNTVATQGMTAAVYDVSVTDNHIEDRSFMYNVLRFGNMPNDADNRCERITSARNRIGCRMPTGANGALAQRNAHNPGGLDPTIAAVAIKNTDHNAGTGFTASFSNNTSTDDLVFTLPGETTETINTGFTGWGMATNPATRGNIFTGISFGSVVGGLIEASGRPYYNCSVTGGRSRATLPGSYTAVFDGAAKYTLTGLQCSSAGGFVRVAGNATVNTKVRVTACVGSATAAGAVGISNGSAVATVVARLNDIDGVTAASGNGAGGAAAGVTSSLNLWNGVAD